MNRKPTERRMTSIAVLIDGKYPHWRLRRPIQAFLRWVGKLGGLEVHFVPWGKENDHIGSWVLCPECSQPQFVQTCIYNTTSQRCGSCTHEFKTFSDGRTAWVQGGVTND